MEEVRRQRRNPRCSFIALDGTNCNSQIQHCGAQGFVEGIIIFLMREEMLLMEEAQLIHRDMVILHSKVVIHARGMLHQPTMLSRLVEAKILAPLPSPRLSPFVIPLILLHLE
jgi:hypothetical protein